MKYFFILGQNPTASVAEILSKISQKSDFKCSSSALVLDYKNSLNFSFLDQLGGTKKFGKIIKVIHKPSVFELKKLVPKFDKKIHFGFSIYKLDEKISNKRLKSLNKQIYKLGLELKNKLKEDNISSRFVTSKEIQLSSVIVQKNKLLGQGIEFVFLVDENKILLGQTLAVQKFQEYGFRDIKRPGRDILSGMLPPKLAKMMINFSQTKPSQTLLDPFCGSGTILQEAILLGYKNIIGTDISGKAIKDTNDNLEWLKEKFNLQKIQLKIFQCNVLELSENIKPNSVDYIITEPYLGPPLKGSEPKQKLESIVKELSGLYIQSFKEFKKVLKPDGRIVIIFPIFVFKNQNLHLEILNEIKKLGFKTINPIEKELVNKSCIQLTKCNSIVYSRPKQKVLREIFIFKI